MEIIFLANRNYILSIYYSHTLQGEISLFGLHPVLMDRTKPVNLLLMFE